MLPLQNKLTLTVGIITHLLAPVYGFPSSVPRDLETRAVPLRIMPIGDSITWGYELGQGTNGYRQQLLTDLVSAGYQVDFLGTQHSGTMVDNANEGYPGYRISQIQAAIAPGLASCPNVALVHAGTNDFTQPDGTQGESWYQAPARLGNLMDSVLARCPRAVILVAKIIQRSDAQGQYLTNLYNDYMPNVVNDRVNRGYKVKIVDQSVIGESELSDGIHPTPAGYDHMGHIWSAAVVSANNLGLITA
ncbi:hypothetical protein IFR05_012605 [Cadophora sp. M221]|nr:hypothetical protein IFR05_012605 [Cadophora sp. M221]